MKKYLLAILPALALVVGCAKAPQGPVFTGTTEDGLLTKTSISYDLLKYIVNWQSSDKVRINDAKYAVSPGTPATTASFTWESGTTPEGTFKACTPYDNTVYSGGVMKVNFPASITNTFHDVTFWPMYAEGTSTSLSFKNLAGLVAVSIINSDKHTVKSVKITSSGNCLSGAADIVADGSAWKASIPSGGDNVTVNCTTPLNVDSWNYVFVPVPPKVYGTNFTITITYGDNTTTVKTVKAGSSIEVKRSMVTSIALNLYSPTSSANEDIGWGNSYTEANFE